MRVEIFPTTATFYPASSLSSRDIEVSGAIGICKFNKIMLLSPRNLARGYRWTDALSHEYIHYIIVQLSHNRAPIWLHEGIAKYFESAWRLPQGAWLDRRSESLLAHALRHNSFVGFKNMDPSLVKLDTTYQVQLAYAEASSAIDFIVQQRGAEGLLGVLQTLRQTQRGRCCRGGGTRHGYGIRCLSRAVATVFGREAAPGTPGGPFTALRSQTRRQNAD